VTGFDAVAWFAAGWVSCVATSILAVVVAVSVIGKGRES